MLVKSIKGALVMNRLSQLRKLQPRKNQTKADMEKPLVVASEMTPKEDARKDWAMFFVSGGGVVMTIFTSICLWLIRDIPGFVFWLGLAAMGQILVIFSGLLGLLVKRSLKISRNEISISDFDNAVSREAVEEAIEEVPSYGEYDGRSNQPGRRNRYRDTRRPSE